MSYCRWSTDDFSSDIYCYAGCDDMFHINIAANRHVFEGDLPKKVSLEADPDAYFARRQEVMRLVDLANIVPITLPMAGEEILVDTPQEAVDMLLELRETGYNVPQHAIEALMIEAEEVDNEDSAVHNED